VRRRVPVFLLAVALGLTIWLLSPWVTGQREPWDSASPYYLGSLFVAGALTGFLGPRPFWLWPLGIWLGQLVVLLAGPWGPLLPLGIVFLLAFTLVALAGAAVGAALRRRSKGVP